MHRGLATHSMHMSTALTHHGLTHNKLADVVGLVAASGWQVSRVRITVLGLVTVNSCPSHDMRSMAHGTHTFAQQQMGKAASRGCPLRLRLPAAHPACCSHTGR